VAEREGNVHVVARCVNVRIYEENLANPAASVTTVVNNSVVSYITSRPYCEWGY
jgi:hypothetical protein